MPAGMFAAFSSLTPASSGAYTVPDALQQLLHKIEERGSANPGASQDLYRLKSDLENRWQIASSEGHTSSTMLYEILEYGWTEMAKVNLRHFAA